MEGTHLLGPGPEQTFCQGHSFPSAPGLHFLSNQEVLKDDMEKTETVGEKEKRRDLNSYTEQDQGGK